MDPFTHSALGAAVAGVIAGKKELPRAPVYGALAGALPDMDIIPTLFMGSLSQLDFHRGFTHSILFALLASPILGFIINRATVKYRANTRFWFWTILVFFALLSHIAIDCLTSYGTRIFIPFSDYRVAFGTIAIVDPLFSIPIAVSAISIIALRNNERLRDILFAAGLVIGSAYLLSTIVNKLHIDSVFHDNLRRQNIEYDRLMTTPMPVSNLLWVGIAGGPEYFYTGYYSVFDRDDPITFERYKKNHEYISNLSGYSSIKKIISFSKDFYAIDVSQGYLIFNDLRYGSLASGSGAREFIFSYIIKNNHGDLDITRKDRSKVTPGRFLSIMKRIIGKKQGHYQ